MKQVNKTMGNHFEEELCELLAEQGFWAHNLAQNQVGQPADVLAVRDNIAVLIDCKVCSNNRFPLSRIEPNQEAAMTMWEAQGNEHYLLFVVRCPGGRLWFQTCLSSFILIQEYHDISLLSRYFLKFFQTFSPRFAALPVVQAVPVILRTDPRRGI